MSTPPSGQGPDWRPAQGPAQGPGQQGPGQQGPGGYPPPQGGSYPSPQGAYPPPPQGGSYPPPQGGFPPPGQPGAYPPPPGQPGGFGPPPGQPPKGRSVGKRIAIALVGIAVLIGVRVGYTQLRNNDAVAPEASKGECLHVIKASATDTETEKVGCGDPTGLYEVASTSDGTATCPSEDYLEYTKTAGKAKTTLCLLPNLAEGTCYSGLTGVYSVAAAVDCTDPAADAKVGLRRDGVNDPSVCDEFGAALGAALAYPDPQRTYCLVAADA